MPTRLTDSFGIRHPIVCAPMALITGGGYAGVLGGEPDLKQELAHVQGHKFGIGFITWALARAPEVLDEMLSYSPYCVFLSFGDPKPFSARIRKSGARLICQVQSLRHIDEAIDAGAAAIVAQGTEAGGHGATRSTLPFVPEAADYLAKKAPTTLLLAAGGIADGRGLAGALMLGADGVVVGTRFLASEESLAPAAISNRAARATGEDTVRTKAVDALRGVSWPEEFSYRVFKNKLTEQWRHREADATAAFGSLAAVYTEAGSRRDLDIYAVGAGECVGLIHDRPSASNIVESMVTDARSLLQRGGTLNFADSPANHAMQSTAKSSG